MKNLLFAGTLFFVLISCPPKQGARLVNPSNEQEQEQTITLPAKNKLWVFILAGQSNMAGRGLVEPSDTVTNARIWTITKDKEWILAKEPLHFYEPNLVGLDCGLSFGKELIQSLNDSISIALIPCAVGGSSSQQWVGDSIHRGVQLLTNFKEKVSFTKKYGTIKGILWHQGESDATPELIPTYAQRLDTLFTLFRNSADNPNLPILMGELGSFAAPEHQHNWNAINTAIHSFAAEHPNTTVIATGDLGEKGDHIHFDSAAQRTMGKRFARKFVEEFMQ